TSGELFALDCQRRFISMYGSVVLGIDSDKFAAPQHPLTIAALRDTVVQHAGVVELAGLCIPDAPIDQLRAAVVKVIESWMGDRAITYRKHKGIPDTLGTAVNVQLMVFGNANATSASGVLFTRDPATGTPGLFGEFLQNAQGGDVVSGERTPELISELQRTFAQAYAELSDIVARLETHYRDMQDIEFTIENGALFILQTRRGQRTAQASLRIALDMLDERLITENEAVLRVIPADVASLTTSSLAIDPAHAEPDARGIGASPGAAVGRIALTAAAVRELEAAGEPAILLRRQTSAGDIDGIINAHGVLTQHGGATSHAAVVTRGLGRPCIVGCGALEVNEQAQTVHVGDLVLQPGDMISIDGATGEVFARELALVPATAPKGFDRLLDLAAAARTIGVRANADLPDDARRALAQGAEGIGLCRTEHMFFAPDRLPHFLAAILATSDDDRARQLAALGALQEADFRAMFETMAGKTVTVRLLDPPLHEFLPNELHEQATLAQLLGISVGDIATHVDELAETNPMLGNRGVRLGLTHPDIYDMQVQAIVRALISARVAGIDARPAIMIPLVALEAEIVAAVAAVRKSISLAVAGAGSGAATSAVDIPLGTMIEVPRACMVAAHIAQHVSFLSFGTNDLTQLTYGFSRDDSAPFVDRYLADGILDVDPFKTVDRDGVGALIELAIDAARATSPGIEIGVCGEHGGDPASIAFFHGLHVDYVSCAPARLHTAQLAAAHAALRS
ncbi:MAG: pyruvate, phosphate dikinase, partial [Thermoleophilia bacterium]|nr:pyruvate, phosphate dikinase [Thermoleophilia bacterium]